MWTPFFLEHAHFASFVLVGFVLFLAAWLYLDAWFERKRTIILLRSLGFMILSIAYLLNGTLLDSSLFDLSLGKWGITTSTLYLLKTSGIILIIYSLLRDQLPIKPTYDKDLSNEEPIPLGHEEVEHEDQEKRSSETPIRDLRSSVRDALHKVKQRYHADREHDAWGMFPLMGMAPLILVQIMQPILALVVAGLFILRATRGLEKQLKAVGFGFILLAIADLSHLGILFRDTEQASLYRMVAPYGPLWMIEHIAILLATIILARWAFTYLLKRFQTQLFIIFISTIVGIFLFTSVCFTALLLYNTQSEVLDQLGTSARVLRLTLDTKQDETRTTAELTAQNATVVQALTTGRSTEELPATLASIMLPKKQTTLAVVDASGVVIARAENPEQIGDSLSGNSLVVRALAGESVSSFAVQDGVMAPQVWVQAVVPVIGRNEAIIGAVIAGTEIDNSFLDGIQKATGLEASLYADNTVTATTLVSSDGKTRPVGTTEEDERVTEAITSGQSFGGEINIRNTSYFGVFEPLIDLDTVTIGMIFVGTTQTSLLHTAGNAIELTFLVTAMLLIISILPALVIARYIARQV